MENDDKMCISQLKEGSEQAFSELYMRFSNKLYGFALAQTKNTSLAEDIVQETFMKLWNTREQLDCYGNVHALLFTIARNLIIDSFRKQNAKIDFEDYQKAAKEISPWPSPHDQIEHQESIDRLQQSKKLLSKRECQIYEMSKEQHMPIQEIADSLNLSSQTVKNYLSSSLKLLRKKMST